MAGFPKGLNVLLVDRWGVEGAQALALRNPEWGYEVTTVQSLEAALACFSSTITAYDCVVLEHSLLADAPEQAAALFSAAHTGQAPVVLMSEALSPEAVLQGVHLGAVDFLACPLSQQKLRNLWQHKIRRMMQSSSEGCALPRPPSCPQLAATAAAGNNSSGAAARPLRHSISTPGFSCPTPPAVATAAGAAAAVCSAAPESSFSLGSFSLGSVSLGSGWGNCLAGTASAAAAVASDATSGAPHPQPAGSPPVLAPQSASLRAAAVAPGVAAPVAPRQWPALPSGTAWGTPVGFGMPPPALSQPAQAPPNSARPPLAIRWCLPGTLPLPASTSELLLPDDFSLACPTAATAGTPTNSSTGGIGGPLRLRLTVTSDLLAAINAAVAMEVQAA